MSTTNGKATVWLTNRSAFEVFVHGDPGFYFETLRSNHWEHIPPRTNPGDVIDSLLLRGHEATSLTEVVLPELHPGMVWRLRLSVFTQDGILKHWLQHPRDLLDSLHFRDAQGRFTILLSGRVFPTTTMTTTQEVRVE